MRYKIIIIIIVIVMIIIIGISINNKRNNKYWCDIDNISNVIVGEITSVSNGKLLLKTSEKNSIEVNHKANIKFNVGDKIRIVFDGFIKESNPPQIIAISIELI